MFGATLKLIDEASSFIPRQHLFLLLLEILGSGDLSVVVMGRVLVRGDRVALLAELLVVAIGLPYRRLRGVFEESSLANFWGFQEHLRR